MRYFISIFIVIFSLLTTGCTKDQLPVLPENNSPIYKVTGTLNGEEISFDAGVNGMYMQTNFSYFNAVLQHNAHLMNEENHFNISFADENVDIPLYNIDYNSLTELDLITTNTGNLLELSKESFYNYEAISSISWTVDGVNQVGEAITITEPGFYSICATIEFNNGTQRSLCNNLLVGYQKNTAFGVRYFINQEDEVNCFVDVPESAIESITWNINDSIFSTATTFSFELEAQVYHIEAAITLNNGVKRTKRILVDGINPSNSIEDFSIMENQNQNNFWDLGARLSVMLDSELWKPINSEEKILLTEIKQNGVNEAGQTIYEVIGSFDGTMFNQNTLQEAAGSFAFELAFAIP